MGYPTSIVTYSPRKILTFPVVAVAVFGYFVVVVVVVVLFLWCGYRYTQARNAFLSFYLRNALIDCLGPLVTMTIPGTLFNSLIRG